MDGLRLILILLASVARCMRIIREIENPELNFELTEGCSTTPNPKFVVGNNYFLVECPVTALDGILRFTAPMNHVYDMQFNEIPVLTVRGEPGKMQTLYIQTCKDVMEKGSCTKYQVDVKWASAEPPQLSQDGLIFSSYAKPPPLFDPAKRTYDVVLFSKEPVTVTAKANPNEFVDVNSDPFSENSFVMGSKSIVFTPQESSGKIEPLYLWVTNANRSQTTKYTINVHLSQSINPNLSSVSVYPGRLDPKFQQYKYSYFYRVPENTKSVTMSFAAVNDHDTQCKLADLALPAYQWKQSSLQTILGNKLFGDSNNNTDIFPTAPEVQNRVELDSSGSVTLSLPPHVPSSVVIVDCFAVDKTYHTRYSFTVVRQYGGETLLKDLQVDNGIFDRPFQPRQSGPYFAHIGNSATEDSGKWVRFLATPSSNKAIIEVEGRRIGTNNVSQFFQVKMGEKRRFRISVRTAENPVEEEYFVIVQRVTPWYSRSSLFKNIGNWVGLVSTIVSSSNPISFINNAKMLQYLSMSNRINGNPEQYEAYSSAMHKYNLQWVSSKVHLSDADKNVTFYAAPDDYSDVLEAHEDIAKSTLTYSDIKNEFTKAAAAIGLLPSIVNSLSKGDVEHISKEYGLFVKGENDAWNAGTIESRADLRMAVVAALKENFSSPGSSLSSVEPMSLRQLFDDSYSHDETVQDLDYDLNQRSKLLGYCSSIVVTTGILLLLGVAYCIVWETYLRDKTKSGLHLRQDFPSVLHPARFWIFVYDYSLISTLQASLGILMMERKFKYMTLIIFRMSLSARKLAWLAILSLFAVPLFCLAVGSIILIRIVPSLVFSTTLQRYHDESVSNVNAKQSYLAYIPFLCNFFSVEISNVASVSPHPQGQSGADSEILFDEAANSNVPLCLSARNPQAETKSEVEQDVEYESGKLNQPGYTALHRGAGDETTHRYDINEDRIKVRLLAEEYDARLDNFDAELYSRYPDANVGFATYKIRNAYDKPLNVSVQVNLRHLPAILNLRSYSLWVPSDNMGLEVYSKFGLLFGASPKGIPMFWMFERCLMSSLIILVSLFQNSRGAIHLTMFLLIASIGAALFFNATFQTADSKWHRKKRLYVETQMKLKKAEESRRPIWPFHRAEVKAKYSDMKELTRLGDSNGLAGHLQKYIISPWESFIGSEWWDTKLYLWIHACATGPFGIESFKFVLLLFIFTSNGAINVLPDFVGSVLSITVSVIALTCINHESIPQLKRQLYDCVQHFSNVFLRLSITIYDLLSTPRLIGRKITHVIASTQRYLQGERGVGFHYPGFHGETIRNFHVQQIKIVNNEVGVHFNGKIKQDTRTRQEIATCSLMERGVYEIQKTLHIYGSTGVSRPNLTTTMPIQIPFKQFYQLGKSTDSPNSMMKRLCGTLQIVNYNESRGASNFDHGDIDDSFLSFYADAKLLPEFGNVQTRTVGHGYVVRWLSDRQMIQIKGPSIVANQEYNVCTVQTKPELDPDDDIFARSGSLSTIENRGVRQGEGVADAHCFSGGLLSLSILPGEVPDLTKPLQVRMDNVSQFDIDPTESFVDYYEYNVGKTRRCCMTLRSQDFVVSPHPYTVRWSLKGQGKNISVTATAASDGVLHLPWSATEAPNLVNFLEIRNESEGKLIGSVIDVDPRQTDEHEFVMPLTKFNSMGKVAGSIYGTAINLVNCIRGRDITKEIASETVPCTVVQCIDDVNRTYRIEPNFAITVKRLKSLISQLVGVKQDLKFDMRLGYLWMDFMSSQEFVSFWENAGVPIVIRGAWVNPLTNSQHLYVKENIQKVVSHKEKFRAEVSRRIDQKISSYNKVLQRFRLWATAYEDLDLYAASIKQEKSEWGNGDTHARRAEMRKLVIHYTSLLPDFVYPMTVPDTMITKRSRLDAQLRVWREDLAAWLYQCEAASHFHSRSCSPVWKDDSNAWVCQCDGISLLEQGGRSCAQATVDDFMRAMEHNLRRPEQVDIGLYRSVVHFVTSSAAVRGRAKNWSPDPLVSHYCRVRLFRSKQNDESVDWSQPIWTPCFLKLSGHRIIMLFPTAQDALAVDDDYDENDLSKRFSWNQLQAYSIPLECIDRMFLSLDSTIQEDTKVGDEVKRMHAKLVLKKTTEYFIDDAYVKSLWDGKFMDKVLFKGSPTLKIRLCNTVSNRDHHSYSGNEKFFYGDRCSVLPLTFRFHVGFFNKWQSAIRLAELNNPRTDPLPFYGRLESSNYDDESVYRYPGPPQPPLVSDDEEESDSTGGDSVVSYSPERPNTDLTVVTPPPVVETRDIPQQVIYKGEFRDFRFSGKNGILKENGNLIYHGDWVEGQRWGHGKCNFTDAMNHQWEFSGEFIADEMRKGCLLLTDQAELARLKSSHDVRDKNTIMKFEGVFALSAESKGALRHVHRMNSACMRGPVRINPNFMKNLFEGDGASVESLNGQSNQNVVIDLRRAISSCADENVNNATLNLVYDNMGKSRATKYGRQSSNQSQESDVTQDALNALEEYLPHRSKWSRLMDPNAGYQALLDRMAEGDVLFADGCRYRGCMKNSLPHGRGIYFCPKCNLTVNGFFKNGRPDGLASMTHGAVTSPDYTEYNGEFRKGKRHGKGTQLVRERKIMMKGEFVNDELEGTNCSMEIAENILSQYPQMFVKFTGGMKNGIPDGEGRLEWPDGSIYRGDLKAGLRHGSGLIKDKDKKTIINGTWDHDFPDGRISSMALPDGRIYTGEVRKGQRQGMGETFIQGVSQYEGLWMNDLPNGRGTLYCPDGEYEGQFKSGKRHGKGRFTFKEHPLANGRPRVFEGDWENDKPHGIGRYLNELSIENTYKFSNGELQISSVKQYKAGPCGKAPLTGVKFEIMTYVVTGHDPKYWGVKRKLEAEKVKRITTLGSNIWENHCSKPFAYMDHLSSPNPFPTDGIPNPTSRGSSVESNKSTKYSGEVIQMNLAEANVTQQGLTLTDKLPSLYCRVKYGDTMKQTKPMNNTMSPRWNQRVYFTKKDPWATFEVWDSNTMGSDSLIGSADVNLQDLFTSSRASSLVLNLYQRNQQSEKMVGTLNINMALVLEPSMSDVASMALSSVSSENGEKLSIVINSYENLSIEESPSSSADPKPAVIFECGRHRVETPTVTLSGVSGIANVSVQIPVDSASLRFEVWNKQLLDQYFIGYGQTRIYDTSKLSVPIYRESPSGPVSAGAVVLSLTQQHV